MIIRVPNFRDDRNNIKKWREQKDKNSNKYGHQNNKQQLINAYLNKKGGAK